MNSCCVELIRKHGVAHICFDQSIRNIIRSNMHIFHLRCFVARKVTAGLASHSLCVTLTAVHISASRPKLGRLAVHLHFSCDMTPLRSVHMHC